MIFFSETLVFFVFMYLLQTILEWASPSDDKPVTLVAVLVTQCHWLVALMHRIW